MRTSFLLQMTLKRSLSFVSTESLSDNELGDSYDVLPHDLYHTEPSTGDRVLVAKEGEKLPIEKTKFKKRSSWGFCLKFRSDECHMCFIYFSW